MELIFSDEEEIPGNRSVEPGPEPGLSNPNKGSKWNGSEVRLSSFKLKKKY